MAAVTIALVVFYVAASSSGLFFNSFLAVVGCRTCLNSGFQNPRDLLLFSIGLSNVVFGSFQFFTNLVGYIWIDTFATFNICNISMGFLYVFTVFLSSCMTSFLCSFYCIKLVTFQHRLLARLRSLFPSLLPWMLAGIFVVSGILLVALVSVIGMTAPLLHDESIVHCPRINETYKVQVQAIMVGLNSMIVLPFLLIMASLGATLVSLTLYIWKLQKSSSFDNSHLRGHSDAAMTMLLLLALNFSFCTSHLLLTWNLVASSSPLYTLCLIIFFSFWTLQAFTLIIRTKKFNFKIPALQSPLKVFTLMNDWIHLP